jgi:D-sedoheptulose 7-phosphate isomerase
MPAKLLFDAWRNDCQVFLAGNGGSASTASHFAADLAKFCSVKGKHRFKAISLVDNMSWFSALVNDIGWENVYVEQLKNLLRKGDVLTVISVHGGTGEDKAGIWSQNLLKAVKYVQDNDGKVLGLAGFDGGALKNMADVCVVVPVNSTPLVEGIHLILTHLICTKLHELIENYKGEEP